MASERISVSSASTAGVVGSAVGVSGAAADVHGAAVGVSSGAAADSPDAAIGVLRERALDALLTHASTPPPPKGLEERVLEAIHREEASPLTSLVGDSPTAPRLRPAPWYARRRVWLSSAAAACLFAALLPLLPLGMEEHSGESLAIDDTILVDDALELIADEELITAICSVSTGKDNFMSNQ